MKVNNKDAALRRAYQFVGGNYDEDMNIITATIGGKCAALQAENERLKLVCHKFFKVVEVDGKQYRPSQQSCAGCEHLTVARGWECYYKRDTTDCAYPDSW